MKHLKRTDPVPFKDPVLVLVKNPEVNEVKLTLFMFV